MADDTAVVRRPLPTPPFEAWMAVVALYAGLSHLLPFLAISGSAKLVELKFPHLVNVWSVLYALGGGAMLAGLFRRSPRIEGAGLCLFASGIITSCIAGLAAGAQLLPVVVVQGGVVFACAARLQALRNGVVA